MIFVSQRTTQLILLAKMLPFDLNRCINRIWLPPTADACEAWIETHRQTVDGGGVSVKTNWNLGFDQEPKATPY